MSNMVCRAQIFYFSGDRPGNLEERVVSKEVQLTKDELEIIVMSLEDMGRCNDLAKKIRRLLK